MARRGPKPRAGSVADQRIEIRLTLDELRELKRLATKHGHSVADLLRLGAVEFAAQAGDAAPLGLGAALVRRITSGSISGRPSH